MLIRLALFLVALGTMCQTVSARVIINEVFYHAPDDIDDLEWIELHNTSTESVDVSAWSLSKGVEFKVPAGTVIPPRGFLVICKDVELFHEFYDVPAVGGFARSLNNKGETIELSDASAQLVDAVTYADRAPWAVSADGYGASLERITPVDDSSKVENWASSSLPLDGKLPLGTPGTANDSFSANPPPRVSDVSISPAEPAPGEPLVVSCAVTDVDGVSEVHVLFRAVSAGQASDEQRLAMSEEADGKYRVVLPAQQAGDLVRVRILAVDQAGTLGLYPHVNALRPAVSVYVMEPPGAATIPLAFIINTDADMAGVALRVWKGSGRGMQASMMRRQVQTGMDAEFDLGTPWYQLTVNQSPTHDVYLRLRDLFNKQKAKRQALVDGALAAADMQSEMQALPGRAKQFSAELTTAIKTVLPAADAKKYRPTGRSFLSGPSDTLKQMLKLEQLWFAIGTEFQCTDQQLQKIGDALKNIHQARRKLLPMLAKMMIGLAGFEDLQVQIGKIEGEMWKELEPALSFRQYRFARQ